MPILRTLWQRCTERLLKFPDKLINRTLALQLDDYPPLQVRFTQNSIEWLPFDGRAELTVSGPSGAFVNYLIHQNPSMAAQRGLKLLGATDIAQVLQSSLKVEPKIVETSLRYLLHPWLAYPLTERIHQAVSHSQSSMKRLLQTQFDYWHYETDKLATQPEIEHFIEAVDALNLACERLTLQLALTESHARSHT